MSQMKIEPLDLPGVLLISPQLHSDERGTFVETYQQQRYQSELKLPIFVQDNRVLSRANVLRGLHFQPRRPQAKLISVISGAVVDVVVDIDPQSPTYLRHLTINLNADSYRQLFIPAGYAHGYYVLSKTALVDYKCSELYQPEDQGGLRWDDPALAIDWPLRNTAPIVSLRDQQWPLLTR